jgi:hypothetical protein
VEVTRRGFLAGLGAMLAATLAPPVPAAGLAAAEASFLETRYIAQIRWVSNIWVEMPSMHTIITDLEEP